jgi:hypothetical protein
VSLSDERVVSSLNRYFVPVYLANEDYRDGGAAPAEERAELQRIHREGHAAKLSVGTVHAFVLAPDGRLMDSLHVVDAAKADNLVAMLDRTVKKLDVKGGEPLVRPAPPACPAAPPGGLLLHLTARYLEKRGDRYALVQDAGGNWSALPGEDWIPLTAEEAAGLIPAGKPAPGQAWQLPAAVTNKLLTHFYPPTENNDVSKNRIEQARLTGTVLAAAGGVARGRIEGALRMGHSFYHKEDGNTAEAAVAGYVEWEPATRRVRSLKLTTVDATYGGSSRQPYGVVVASQP